MTIEIAPISEATIDGYNACVTSVALERRWLGLAGPADPEISRSFSRKNMQVGNPHLVAMDGNRVVGWCDITRNEREGFRHCGEPGDGRVEGLPRPGSASGWRWPPCNRRGPPASNAELDVYASNQPAIKLYEKLGFAVEGMHRRARKLDGQYDDIISMALLYEPKLDSLGRRSRRPGLRPAPSATCPCAPARTCAICTTWATTGGQITSVAAGRMTLQEMWQQACAGVTRISNERTCRSGPLPRRRQPLLRLRPAQPRRAAHPQLPRRRRGRLPFSAALYHIAIPGFVYGGLIASLVDCHAMGTAAAAALVGLPPDAESPRFVTASLKVDYLRPTPLGPTLELAGRVVEMTGRKAVVAVTVAVDGAVTARRGGGRAHAGRLAAGELSAGTPWIHPLLPRCSTLLPPIGPTRSRRCAQLGAPANASVFPFHFLRACCRASAATF
ncbi:MAG: hotdog domain-containing protein [Caldilineales bacterium]